MLIKRTERQARRSNLAAAIGNQTGGGLDRRTFLRKSGLVAGGLATIGALPLASVRKAEAAGPNIAGATIRKNICTHCSVGCTVIGEVSNGVWVGQEPGWESPINRGSHCAKGAATRELVHGDRRLRYPMKLVNGQWTRISWDVAINEIGDKMNEIRAKSGAESVYWLGSAKFTNEGSYLFRKFAAFWGTNIVRPPGAHLSLNHRRRRGQYLGLRRDDQQLHRHPQLEDHHLHGLECRGSASGVAAARAGRQGSSIAPT